jgi:hypothetical protein
MISLSNALAKADSYYMDNSFLNYYILAQSTDLLIDKNNQNKYKQGQREEKQSSNLHSETTSVVVRRSCFDAILRFSSVELILFER